MKNGESDILEPEKIKEIIKVTEIQHEHQNSQKVDNLIQRVGNLIDMQSIDKMIDMNIGND